MSGRAGFKTACPSAASGTAAARPNASRRVTSTSGSGARGGSVLSWLDDAVAVDLDDNNRGHRVENRSVDVQESLAALGRDGHRYLILEAVGTRDLVFHCRNLERCARLVEEREVDLARFRRDAPFSAH